MHPMKVATEAIDTHGALQKPGELAGFLALLTDLKPQVIVEIGCDAGGTLWAWQQLVPQPRKLIGVDLPKAAFSSGRELDTHGAEMVYGDSHADDTYVALVEALDDDPVDFLFIDGDHTYAGIKQDYETYVPLLADDGIVMLHDVCWHPEPARYGYDNGVNRLFRELWDNDDDKDTILCEPMTWGGIGWIRPGRKRAGRMVAFPTLGAATELVAR
jgi:predicted O-methyltransferase YrrM